MIQFGKAGDPKGKGGGPYGGPYGGIVLRAKMVVLRAPLQQHRRLFHIHLLQRVITVRTATTQKSLTLQNFLTTSIQNISWQGKRRLVVLKGAKAVVLKVAKT
eukprot:7737644-Karenia_brevis.AAC.1